MFYSENPKFSSLMYFNLNDKDFISFITIEKFNVNNDWSFENPVLHFLLANELFNDFERFLNLIPKQINPNLCDGARFGKKSLLIILVMLVSNGTLPLKFIQIYKDQLNFDYQDATGRTALHYAIILGRYEIVNMLIACGVTLSIVDEQRLRATAYVSCSEDIIISILKKIDIDPYRDCNASSNKLRDQAGRNLFLQGIRLQQTKSVVNNILERCTKENMRLVRYINGCELWGVFVGDNEKRTVEYLFKLAQQIAEEHHIPIEKVWTPTDLKEEHSAFIEYLQALHEKLSGISILSICRRGHTAIRDALRQYNLQSDERLQSTQFSL